MVSLYELYDVEDLIKQDIVTVMRNLYRRGLISALSGNISVRVPGTEYIWITPSSIYKAEIKTDDMIKMDLNGNIIEGHHKPSSEWRFHVAIYKSRPDIAAVVHTHNPNVLILDLLDMKLDPKLLIESKFYIKGIEYVAEAEPGSEELAKNVAEKVSKNVNALILKKHGVVSLGTNIYEAETIAETIEDLAIVQLNTLFVKLLIDISKNL
ncbi:MAG: class II aldolase/adducin family protein [Ignisphaera sp.]